MKILAIESSCDETAASVIEITEEQRNKETKKHGNNSFSVLSNVVSSQVNIHAKYGGVVPEVAARCHAENIMPVILESLKNLKNPQKEVEAIAVTQGPGLITSLRVGVEAAKTLAYAWKKPLIAVNHVIAHIYANWLTAKFPISNFQFPILCLVVSGGHTMLVLMKGRGKGGSRTPLGVSLPPRFKIVGQTLDDAAGECFDKAAKILWLGYPGGPAIAARAANSKFSPCGGSPEGRQTPNSKISLPRPMLNSPDFNFSFSGLKTAVLYKVMKFGASSNNIFFERSEAKSRSPKNLTEKFATQMATETQNAIVDVLVSKTIRAAKKYNVKTVMLGGGVAANQELRKRFRKTVEKDLVLQACKTKSCKQKPNFNLLIPDVSLCTDNAAMIAVAAYFNPKYVSWDRLEPEPNLSL